MSKTGLVRIALVTIIVLLAFAGIVNLLNSLLIPQLPENWQSNITLFVSSLAVAVVILSGIAQLTGLGIKDILGLTNSNKESLLSHKQNFSAILQAEKDGELNFKGDILQHGSTKIVVSGSNESRLGETSEDIERLIRDIQANLQGDDNQLPYVLTLCKDLSDRTGLAEKYERWLRSELRGYNDLEALKKEFDEEYYNAWIDEWARARLVQTHVKVSFRSDETGQNKIMELPYEKVIIAFSVAEIISRIADARKKNAMEFSMPLRNLGEDSYSELQSFVREAPLKLTIPPDLEVFFYVSDLQSILTGIRDMVLTLLSDVRQKQRKFGRSTQ